MKVETSFIRLWPMTGLAKQMEFEFPKQSSKKAQACVMLPKKLSMKLILPAVVD